MSTPDLYRVSRSAWAALLSRFDQRIKRSTLAAASTTQIAPLNDRHSIRIKNVGTVPLRLGHSQADAESSDEFVQLDVGEEKYYRIHYNALEPVLDEPTGMVLYKIIYHCEWNDEMWCRNPDALVSGVVEVTEVY